ncbi:glycosyltransferase 61 family protein [Azospirillum sp. sgz301742]
MLRQVSGLYLTIGNTQAAEWCARRALAADASVAEIHLALGDALEAQGRHSEAVEAYERAIALHPLGLNAQLKLASALKALGRDDEAARQLDAAAANRAQDADALHRIGALLFDLGHEVAAAEIYRRFAAITGERTRFPGNPPRRVRVRPAAEACRAHGWPYHTVASPTPVHLTDATGASCTYETPEAFLAFAENAVIVPRVHAPLVGGDTLLIDGFSTSSRGSLTLVPHVVWHSPDERMLLDLPEPARTIEEEAILLGGGPNWSHGVLDWSSKLAVLERFPELRRLPVLVSADTIRPVRDLLELQGLEPDRIMPLTPGEVVCARRLWLPSLTHRYQYTAPMHVEFLRRHLAGPIGEGMGRPRRRIFLSRRQAGYRALLNEAEVLAALAPLGVEPVVAEDFPMAEQIALFASAELIVGPIGGGSAAIVFAPHDAAYVELVHSRITLPQYGLLTALLGQRYRQIVGEAAGNRSRYAFDHDFTVPAGEVATAVRELVGGA